MEESESERGTPNEIKFNSCSGVKQREGEKKKSSLLERRVEIKEIEIV